MKRTKKLTRTKLMTEPDAEAIIRAYMARTGLNKQRAGNDLLRLAGRVKRLKVNDAVPQSAVKP